MTSEKIVLSNDVDLCSIKTDTGSMRGLFDTTHLEEIRKLSSMCNPYLARPLHKPTHPFAKFKGK